MPTLYLRTDGDETHPVNRWHDDPVPTTETAHWELVARADDADEAGPLFETVLREWTRLWLASERRARQR